MIRAWGQSDAARTPAVVAGNEAIRPSGGCASTAFALRATTELGEGIASALGRPLSTHANSRMAAARDRRRDR